VGFDGNLHQPTFGAPLSRRSALTRGLVLATLFNGGTPSAGGGVKDIFCDSARVAGPAEYNATLTNLTTGGSNQFGKFVEFTAAGTSHHIDWPAGGVWVPTNGMTLSLLYEKTDATNRASVAWGIDPVLAGAAYYCHAAMPYSDGVVYFEFGSGNTLSAAGLSFGADHWVFTAGSRGMEIWQNGILRASSATNPTRSQDVTHVFKIGAGLSALGFVADLARYGSLCMWARQLDLREVWSLNTDPYAPWRNPV
jgi:hypothetical protein